MIAVEDLFDRDGKLYSYWSIYKLRDSDVITSHFYSAGGFIARRVILQISR